MSPAPINVLYVEDDADLRALVELIFQRETDMRIHCCEPHSEAEVLQTMHEFRPDIVLLDVMMPCVDGMSLARSMLADPQLKQLPFVFMTAKSRPQELTELRQAGALGVISKPFDAIKLPDELRALLAMHRSR
ncbi:MAG: response regulator [Steroidobacteraceae bacterium]